MHRIKLADLRGIDKQIERVEQNTRQFVDGQPANNVLLTGARGTGKSSLVKGLLNKYARAGPAPDRGREERPRRPARHRRPGRAAPERFILFCDDLSFQAREAGYKALKVALDGSISTTSDNVLIYATSNRRHLMPEYMAENLETQATSATRSIRARRWRRRSRSPSASACGSPSIRSTRTSTSTIVDALAEDPRLRTCGDDAREEALQWALQRGSRSGRVAYQFARDWAGRHAKKK